MSQESHASSSISMRKLQETLMADNLELCIKNDKAEADFLETDSKRKYETVETAQDDERIATIQFCCFLCGMEELVHYFGLEPNFVFGISFNERTYVMRDPFQPPPPKWKSKAEYFVALGAHCKLCDNVVCKDSECSFFYINTYCINCVKKVERNFPDDIQQKLRKQLASSI